MAESIIGRLAPRPYLLGDPVPARGSLVLVSVENCDVESDQHRSYMWRQVIGYSDDHEFICLQTPNCWPTVSRMANCWFADARGMEARSGETEGLDPKGDSPVPSGTRPETTAQAEALTDAERLDFIEREWFFGLKTDGPIRFGFNSNWDAGYYDSLRAAIDASIRAGKGGER